MPLSSGQTVAETFGQYLLLLGPVVNTSWNRHLLGEAPDAEAGPQQQIVILSRGADAGGRPEASQYWNGGNGSWTAADIDLAEHCESLSHLRMRMTGRAGVTTNGFSSNVHSLHELVRRCGGQAAFDKAVFETCQRIHTLEGSLQWNWFQVGYDSHGKLGVLCFTCNGGNAHSIGAVVGNPFNNFIRHCARSNEHKEARTEAQQLADAVMATGECRLSR